MTVELTRITATGTSSESPYKLNLGVDNRSSDNHLVYLTNYYQLDRNRSGTSSFKSKKDVRGGGRKLYKQKGTGRARKGGSRSPLIRGGGKAFGRSARDLSSDLPKKVIQLGIKTTLKLNQDKLCILDKPDTYTQTKSWRGVFDKTKQYLCIINTIQSVLTCMNYPNVTYCYVDGLSVQSILKADQIIIIDDALKIFEELYCVRD